MHVGVEFKLRKESLPVYSGATEKHGIQGEKKRGEEAENGGGGLGKLSEVSTRGGGGKKGKGKSAVDWTEETGKGKGPIGLRLLISTKNP